MLTPSQSQQRALPSPAQQTRSLTHSRLHQRLLGRLPAAQRCERGGTPLQCVNERGGLLCMLHFCAGIDKHVPLIVLLCAPYTPCDCCCTTTPPALHRRSHALRCAQSASLARPLTALPSVSLTHPKTRPKSQARRPAAPAPRHAETSSLCRRPASTSPAATCRSSTQR